MFKFIQFCLACYLFVQTAQATLQWTYKPTDHTCAATAADPCGPEYWGNFNPNCYGNKQSPIDLSNADYRSDVSSPVLQAEEGGCDKWVQFSNDYTFEVAFNDAPLICRNFKLSYKGSTYVLQQIHFHSPSEHTFAGGYYSAEAHLVHLDSNGHYLVLGIPLQAAASTLVPSNNTFFQTMWNGGGSNVYDGTKTEIENSTVVLNPYAGLIPPSTSHFQYNGSFTTPPCSEPVKWFVFDTPVMISQFDLATLRKAISSKPTTIVSANGNDNRPVMPLNGRSVYYVTSFAETGVTSSSSSSNNEAEHKAERAMDVAIAAIVVAAVAVILSIILPIYGYLYLHRVVDELKHSKKELQLTNVGDDHLPREDHSLM